MASIRIFYQPIIRLADLRPDYAEVLARTTGADGTMGGAETVVEAMTGAERSMRLTACIMQRALDEYTEHGFAAQNLRIAINLPLDAMLHPDLVTCIELIRASSGLPTSNIRFELTERHPVHDLKAACAVITTLRAAGYGLALDDITPDMPYLPALLDMPIRAIKLDRSVVISDHPADQEFIRAMAAQAAAKGQDIIAEGIETPTLRDSLRARGVTHGQGYLFSHPLPAAGLGQYLAAGRA
ncbi:hypothetical protein GCM10010909_04510 [Acidocella aquatica]|uniref:EAL domain-containing protein n=1 Tax=Acidocella aquatica TaxID=1922313 RepID=A0ABQ6A2X9_9PROT|nr:EAL domain-containing protein [Acidocella aquatica]GLR65773.1 hypothetical protein GCM10010909_04510 [Acidocella aquatica]